MGDKPAALALQNMAAVSTLPEVVAQGAAFIVAEVALLTVPEVIPLVAEAAALMVAEYY